jgi:hypothetical protein
MIERKPIGLTVPYREKGYVEPTTIAQLEKKVKQLEERIKSLENKNKSKAE